ncbi:hypothetical protein, partial [Chryseobacterium sp. VD8]|uniref:hypothetical protein n=1 Tax=Chryseobacterium sp. VD8 TaxID=3081254 RepID=UPI0030175FE0
PSIPDSLKAEKKALRQSMLQNMLTGNLRVYKTLHKKYHKILKEEKILTELRNKVKEVGLTFLNV